MSDSRKPDLVLRLRKQTKDEDGKVKTRSNKVEIFSAEQWGEKKGPRGGKRYRLRVNGVWFVDIKRGQFTYLTKWEIRDLVWRSIHL